MFWGASNIIMKFEAVTVLSVKIVIFWNKMPCSLVDKYTSAELHSIRTQTVTLLTCFREVPGLNLRQGSDYPDRFFVAVLVLPGKCWDSALN
jgi:hypothetical protein